MTSNTTQNDTSAAHDANSTSASKKMSAALPLVSRRLKQEGIVRVHASYIGGQIMFAFLDAKDQPVGSPAILLSVREIQRVFGSLMARRYPDARNNENVSGIFRWDIDADTIEHEHIVTHHGL
ncbi:MAG: hypothetical protein SXG53_26005 [Pseudomonadota bacterium]|nr:hypothetical protein [Pseudomonadota bacterium]